MGNQCEPIGAIGEMGGAGNNKCGGGGYGPVDASMGLAALKDNGNGMPTDENQGAVGGPYTNGNGYDAPNYDYYLNPDQGQLRYGALMSPEQLQAEFDVSDREAVAMHNSLMHKPADKQTQFLETFRDFRARGIQNPTFDDVKASLVSMGYDRNDQYQLTEITAWTNWFAKGDLYSNLA